MIEQFELFDIQSPCRGICRTDNRGYCVGCYRSREERLRWRNLTTNQKRHILRLAYVRQSRRARRSSIQKHNPDLNFDIFEE